MTALSIPAVLRAHAERQPDARALRTRQLDSWSDWLSWGELYTRLEAVARGLSAEGVRAGDRVVLALPEPRDSLLVILALWRLNAAPVQVGLPFRADHAEGFARNLRELVSTFDAKLVVVPAELPLESTLGQARVLHTPLAELPGGAGEGLLDLAAIQGPAFIQLTSGTTARPKGVVVHHDALVRHVQGFCEVFPVHEGSAGLVWLPMYHDMGLVGGFAFNLYAGGPCSFMSPSDFRRNAYGWIEAMAESRATMTSGPPSAFRLCTRFGKRAVARKLDLSCWEVAVVGAEPIPADVLREFAEAYAPCGFRLETFYPAYGLAEATLCASIHTPRTPRTFDRVARSRIEASGQAEPGDDPNDSVELVALGPAFPGTELRVCDAEGRELPERAVGEIWLRSSSMMAGYYGEAGPTAASFAPGGWLRTGDLGYRAHGQFYVTGRKKEIIVVAGRNLIPSVIEEIVSAVPGIRSGRVTAVGIPSRQKATERLVVVAETRWLPHEHDSLREAIHTALGERGVVADEVVLVAPGILPQTTSGKLQRTAIVRAYTAGELGPRAMEAAP